MNKKDLKTALAFASTDRTRYTIHGVRVEPGRLIATDGHAAIIVHEASEWKPKSEGATIPRDDMKMLESRTLKGDVVVFAIGERTATAEIGGMPIETPIIDGAFPEYDRVIPKPNPERSVRVGAKLLKRICEAALETSDAREVWIDLTFPENEHCAIRFDGERIEGAVMPQRR